MKRFILSAFSVVLVANALAPAAQALPQVDPDFKLQTLRLRELDARSKSEDGQKPYDYNYDQQTTAQTNSQSTTDWQENPVNAESTGADSTVWKNADMPSEANDQFPSLIERRQASLDRS